MADGLQATATMSGADLALALFAIGPHALQGVRVKSSGCDASIRWLELLKSLLPPESPWRKVPVHITEDRLLGALDLAATLSAGRPIIERGLLAEADLGVIVVNGAERLNAGHAAHIAAALDRSSLAVERDGASLVMPARFGVVAVDESATEDERVPGGLADRIGLHADLDDWAAADHNGVQRLRSGVARARPLVSQVRLDEAGIEALCAASVALGIDSLRAPLLAAQAARHAAAFHGRTVVLEEDLEIAARLVLAPRATQLPAEPQQPEDSPGEDEQQPLPDATADTENESQDRPLEDIILEAVRAALPADLLRKLMADQKPVRAKHAAGRQGELRKGNRRGRPAGSRAGPLRPGARLSVLETLRAAAPWQRLRQSLRPGRGAEHDGRRRIEVRPADFRIIQVKQHSESTTIFVVDGSGSSALHRMAEAKGAVELLLSDCYVRRDRVALIAFRGQGSEVLLPPTRSLTRVRRALAALPGGGPTPLAAGIDQAMHVALAERKRGKTPSIVFLTDGKANIARDGGKGRPQGEADALAAAKDVKLAGLRALVIDTSPQRHCQAQQLAQSMGGRYLALPHADAEKLSRAVRSNMARD